MKEVFNLKVSGSKDEMVDRIQGFMLAQFGEVVAHEILLRTGGRSRAKWGRVHSTTHENLAEGNNTPSGVICCDDFENVSNAHIARLSDHDHNVSMDICWRCMDLDRDSIDGGCKARAAKPTNLSNLEISEAATRHVLGDNTGSSWLVSLSKDIVWCLIN